MTDKPFVTSSPNGKRIGPLKGLPFFLAILLTGALIEDCQASETEDRVLAELCRNGMSQTAYLYASAERQRVASDQDAYARWTMRLMEVASQQSLSVQQSPPSPAQAQAEGFEVVFNQFRSQHAGNRRLPWIQWQHARCLLTQSQGQLSRWLAAPAQSSVREQALENVRLILSELDDLSKVLKERIPLAARQSPNDKNQAPANELSDLQIDTVLLKCEALLVRSQLYPSGSRDRIAAATEVEQNADKILNQASREWTNRDKLELARSSAWLDTGRSNEALKELKRLANESTESFVSQRACSVAIEYLVAQGQLSGANEFLNLLRKSPEGPERYLAEIRFLVAELSNKSKPQADKQMAAVLELSRKLGDTYGEYWRWRAEALMVGNVSSESAPSSASIELIKAEVKQLVAAEKYPDAVKKLVQAARNEQALSHTNNALELASLAGALSEQFSQTDDVIELLSTLSSTMTEAPLAPKVHLQAIRQTVAKLRRDVQNPKVQSQYEALLRQHIQLFPESSETADAVQWYKEWMIGRGKSFPMAEVFRNQLKSSRAAEGRKSASIDWLQAVVGNPFSNKPQTDSEVDEEVKRMEQLLTSWNSDADKRLAQTILLAAKTLSFWGDRETCQEQLTVVEGLANQELDEVPKQLAMAIESVLLLRLASTDSVGIAAISGRLKQTSLDSLSAELFAAFACAVIEAQDAMALDHQKDARLAAWNSSTFSTAGQMISMENHRLVRIQAIAWRCQAAGKKEATLAVVPLKALCNKNPRDMFLHWMLANAMAGSDPQEALKTLGQIVLTVPKGSDTFLAARWLQLRLMIHSEDPEKARRAAQLVMATYTLNSRWKSRFDKIARGP